MQVNAINFQQVNANYSTAANQTKKEETALPQMKEAFSSDASMAIKNAMVASININKTETEEPKELRLHSGSNRAKGEITNKPRSYERGEFMVTSGYVLSGEAPYPDTKINAGELVMYGDNGRRMATGLDAVTNKFQAEAKKDENGVTIDDSIVKAGVRFNEVKEKYGDYAIMDENGLVSFYDKDDNKIGTMQTKVKN